MEVSASSSSLLKKLRAVNAIVSRTWYTEQIPNYSQQDAMFLNLFIFIDALQVLGDSSTHHQVHIIVYTASGIVNQYYC